MGPPGPLPGTPLTPAAPVAGLAPGLDHGRPGGGRAVHCPAGDLAMPDLPKGPVAISGAMAEPRASMPATRARRLRASPPMPTWDPTSSFSPAEPGRDQPAPGRGLHAGLEAGPIRPDLDAAPGREITPPPAVAIPPPAGRRPRDRPGRRVRRVRARTPVGRPRGSSTGKSASRLRDRRARRGRTAGPQRARSPPPVPAARSRTFGRRTSSAPLPAWIVRSGPGPCRTARRRPSGGRPPSCRSSSCRSRPASTSVSRAKAGIRPAPSRAISVEGPFTAQGRRPPRRCRCLFPRRIPPLEGPRRLRSPAPSIRTTQPKPMA